MSLSLKGGPGGLGERQAGECVGTPQGLMVIQDNMGALIDVDKRDNMGDNMKVETLCLL